MLDESDFQKKNGKCSTLMYMVLYIKRFGNIMRHLTTKIGGGYSFRQMHSRVCDGK